MSKFTDLHLELEIKAQKFREDPTDENGDKIIAEIVHLIENNASILVDGIPSDVNPNVIVPSGYYANDGRFYIHIFLLLYLHFYIFLLTYHLTSENHTY